MRVAALPRSRLLVTTAASWPAVYGRPAMTDADDPQIRDERFLLFGAGDWGTWADDGIKAFCGSGKVLVVAAGQVDDGPVAVERCRAGTAERFARIGLTVVDPPILTKADADNDRAIDLLANVTAVYVTAGGPRPTVAALHESRLWRAIVDLAIPYVGSSGGAMLLGEWYPESTAFARKCAALRLFPNTVIAPHWNELNEMRPELQRSILDAARDEVLIGLDRGAGLEGDGQDWLVHGYGAVHVVQQSHAVTYREGDRFSLPC